MAPHDVEFASGEVSADHVTFRYAHGEATLLAAISFQISDGECVALVGASGSGKTTLVKLILGMLEPTRGTIRVGGKYASAARKLTRVGTIAAVMQDDTLFAGTIEENIHCFDNEPDVDHVQACALAANVHGDIMDMPMGYLTLVGDMGTSLSGGQKQRIILARALYRRPRLLILDEATSHLDVANESVINEAIRGLKITRLIIAHRPETIASADRVLELTDGSLIERPKVADNDHKQ